MAAQISQSSIDRALTDAVLPLRVWIDIGTSWRSLATWDLESNASRLLVGADALSDNIHHSRQSKSPRYLRVEGACSTSRDSSVAFYKHRSSQCGSLYNTSKRAPRLGVGNDTCTGDEPTKVQVRPFRLDALIRRLRTKLPDAHRIELLKIDVQGAELNCLKSGLNELTHVDNILLEVQDATHESNFGLYDGAPGIDELDQILATVGFRRQYCEWNRWGTQVREMNCFYSNTYQRHATWLWATANFQGRRSMVSYGKTFPSFLHFRVVNHFQTSTSIGDRSIHQFKLFRQHS